MRIRSVALAAAVLLVASACSKSTGGGSTVAAAPAPAVAAAQPAGKWSVALIAQGQALEFVMDLRHGGGEQYTGTVSSQMFPPMSINRATLAGNRMKVFVTAPTGDEASFDIVFSGDTFTGDWAMPGDGSRVSGKRIE
jgi:hypothetical protein